MYVKRLIDKLAPFGDVLDIGFGPWSKEIQKCHIKSHTIISMDPEALVWAETQKGVKIIEDVWQGALESLGVFDTIFYASFSIDMGFKMVYSDAILDDFCKGGYEKIAVSKFLAELEQNGQITENQKQEMIEKYKLQNVPPPIIKTAGQMLVCLKDCLNLHMRKGSRFSCYLKDTLDDPIFFNEIVVNPIVAFYEDERIIVVEKLV